MDQKIGAIATTTYLVAANDLFVDDHCKAFTFGQVWSPPAVDYMTP